MFLDVRERLRYPIVDQFGNAHTVRVLEFFPPDGGAARLRHITVEECLVDCLGEGRFRINQYFRIVNAHSDDPVALAQQPSAEVRPHPSAGLLRE